MQLKRAQDRTMEAIHWTEIAKVGKERLDDMENADTHHLIGNAHSITKLFSWINVYF